MRLIGTGVRLIVVLALIAAVVAIPLVTVYRSRCVEDGERSTQWSFVAPWDDPGGEGCRRHQSGFEVLKDEVGL